MMTIFQASRKYFIKMLIFNGHQYVFIDTKGSKLIRKYKILVRIIEAISLRLHVLTSN